jgi:hypothetical protein
VRLGQNPLVELEIRYSVHKSGWKIQIID